MNVDEGFVDLADVLLLGVCVLGGWLAVLGGWLLAGLLPLMLVVVLAGLTAAELVLLTVRWRATRRRRNRPTMPPLPPRRSKV